MNQTGPSLLPMIASDKLFPHNYNYSLLHVSELDVGADPEVQRLLLAVADQLLLPHPADRLASQVARGVTVHVVPASFSSS